MELQAASEGMPATYEIHGRQFIVVPVGAGTGMFGARVGGPFDSPRGALAQDRPGAAGGGAAEPVDLRGSPFVLALKQ